MNACGCVAVHVQSSTYAWSDWRWQTYACAEPRDFSKLCYGGSTLKRGRCVTMQQQAEATIKSTKSGETTPKRYDKVDQYSHVGSMTCKAL